MSESRNNSSESRSYVSNGRVGPTESTPENIDELISRLENDGMVDTTNVSERVSEAYRQRQKKLEELKELRQLVKKRQEDEQKIFQKLEEDNALLDAAIEKTNQLVLKPSSKPKKQEPIPDYLGYEDWGDESRYYGESRW